MPENVPALPGAWQVLGVFAIVLMLLVTILVALYKGHLYTRPQVEEIIKMQQGRVEDAQKVADRWQQAADSAIAANDANLEQAKLIVAMLQTAERERRPYRDRR
jgi:hypothetical protein